MIANRTLTGALSTAAGVILLTSAVVAETITFTSKLDGASEVPPSASTGTGTLTASFDTASKQLTWTGSTSGLTGDATAAHFHGPADVGGTAPVAVPMASFKATFTGAAALTEAQMANLLAGKWYVNIHTAKNTNGEIRGQLVKDK